MNKKLLTCVVALLITSSQSATAQTMRALSNGFSIGRSSGISSSFRQISSSEANAIIDILSQNVTGDSSGYPRAIPDDNYTIKNNLEPFNIVIERDTNSAGSSETIINNSAFSGFNHSIFLQ